MKSFLEYVAEDILRKHGDNLANVTMVFPNKRASLFLNEHLARLAGRPTWSPAYTTISDLFRSQSQRIVADPIKLVCELHKSFVAQTGIDETLDHFYGWGEILLADFDDIDKNMADADKVLSNLRDIHELDDVSYLSPEQKDAIRQFFSNFTDDHNTRLKERFIRLWSHMADIYHDFNRRLATQNLAYEGALYREVASSDPITHPSSVYAFVGFNLVHPVEQRLFSHLKKQGRAHFYWDFDRYYMDSEAGYYIGQLMADFPNELDSTNADIYDSFGSPKTVSFVSAPTENIQARYVSTWLRKQGRTADGRRTAIVLCNEGLLQTVIHCLPNEVDKVNVTTGYPLSNTPVASLVNQLVNLQTIGYDTQRRRFRLRPLKAVMRHPLFLIQNPEFRTVDYQPTNSELLQWLCQLMKSIATNTSVQDNMLTQESVFRAYTLLNRLLTLVDSGDLDVDRITLGRLIGQLIQNTTIPFHGEPAEGIQVMGVLETRNLDFDHVLLLSCNEGNMPRGVNDTSFIPYSLRKAYGLTTIDHKVAIYSYYFHRLLQRATDVTIAYNNATTDGQRGEMSRFMLQLMVESPHPVHFHTLQAGQQFTPFTPPVIEKTPAVIEPLLQFFRSHTLTPTAINRYMRCPLQFYYHYCCNLHEPVTTDDDTIDNRLFGNIFHDAAQMVYTRLMQKSPRIVASDLEDLLKTRVDIERAVDEAFGNNLPPSALSLSGLQLINREVIIHYLRQLLIIDKRLTPFTITALEGDVVMPLETPHINTTIGGRIDRLDCITDDQGERIRVIDYKTGSRRLHPLADVDAIFQPDGLNNHSDYYLQTILYSCIVSQSATVPVSPALLFIQHAGADDYDPTLCFGHAPIRSVADIRDAFLDHLRRQVDEIFNPAVPFTPTADRTRCLQCPYRQLC